MAGDAGFGRAFPEVGRQITDAALVERFTYHPPRDGQPEVYELFRSGGLDFARLLVAYAPTSPELTRAINAVDEAVMLANAAVARHWDV